MVSVRTSILEDLDAYPRTSRRSRATPSTAKSHIDDLRESPALNITKDLAEALPEAKILAVEPNVSELPKALSGLANVELAEHGEAIERADVLLVLVDHDEFKAVPATALAGKTVVDTKGLWR